MESETIKIRERGQKNIVPDFKVENKGMFNCIVKIENAFLQKLIDMGGMLLYEGRDYFNLYCFESIVMFKVRDYGIYIECISTPPDMRGQGSATKTIKALVHAADMTKTTIRLTTSNVSYDKSCYITPPIAIMIGSQRKGKIPVKQLVGFYLKFGFVQDFPSGKGCWTMEYKPKEATGTGTESKTF